MENLSKIYNAHNKIKFKYFLRLTCFEKYKTVKIKKIDFGKAMICKTKSTEQFWHPLIKIIIVGLNFSPEGATI